MSDGIICREFELTLISAQNLPNVRKANSKNKILAEVIMMERDKITEKRTHADRHNELNPSWYYKFNYMVPESNIMDGRLVVIKLYSHRKLKDDMYIGEVQTSIKWLFDSRIQGSKTLNLPIQNGEVKTEGILNIAYSFGESSGEEPPSKRKAALNATKRIAKGFLKLAVIGAVGEVVEAGIDHFTEDGSADTKSTEKGC